MVAFAFGRAARNTAPQDIVKCQSERRRKAILIADYVTPVNDQRMYSITWTSDIIGAAMIERQQDEDFLADLLHVGDEARGAATDLSASAGTAPAQALHGPILTRGEEQTLLKEANQVDPPTLAPADVSLAESTSATSFSAELVETIRRHPIPAVLFAIGLAYLLTRRRD